MSKTNYVAIAPGGKEVAFHLNNVASRRYDNDLENELAAAVRKAGFTSPRDAESPQMWFDLFRLEICGTALNRMPCGRVTVNLPLARMTQDEFIKEKMDLLNELPLEFHACVDAKAYEDGHSSGYEEVIGCLRELVHMLKEPIKKYTLALNPLHPVVP